MSSNVISDERSNEINSPNYLYECKKCNKLKPNFEYSKDNPKGKGRGYVTQCKKCRVIHSQTEKSKEYRKITRINQSKKHRLNIIFHSSIGNAKKRGLEHSISIDYLEKLWNNQKGLCYYTNREMLKDLTESDSNDNSVSIDRVDSSKGYTEGNVVLCRWIVNRMKNDISHSDFLTIISDINKNFK